MENKNKERIVFLDYIRVIACFLVLMVHASEQYYERGQGLVANNDDRLWMGVWDGISRVSVPLFMIVSAYLLVPLQEKTSWTEFFKRRAKRILPPMFIFMTLYCILPPLWGATTWTEGWHNLLFMPLNFPEIAVHYWFFYVLIGMYLFIPIVSPWLRQATAKQELFFLSIWLLSTCLPYINRFGYEVFGQCWWNRYDMLYNFSGYLGYLVMAHYIRKHLSWNDGRRRIVGFICLIMGAIATVLSWYLQITPGQMQAYNDVEIGWCFCTLNCAIYTFGSFLLFSTIHKPGQGYKLILDISKLSYGMFLVHLFFIWLYASIFMPIMHISIAIPCITAVSYISSYILCKLISYIPGSRWIIG